MENKKSSSSIDLIDLTKDSPRPCRQQSRRKRTRPLSPITLGNSNTLFVDIESDVLLKKAARLLEKQPTLESGHISKDDPKATESDNESSQGLQCPICFDPISSDLEPTATRCGHVFCARCLKACLAKKVKRCPTCKSSITSKTCIRLYL